MNPIHISYVCGHSITFDAPQPTFHPNIALNPDDTIRIKELSLLCFVCNANHQAVA